jgi:hypothetical protein
MMLVEPHDWSPSMRDSPTDVPAKFIAEGKHP